METCLGWVLGGRATTDYTNNNAVENVFKIATAQIDTTPATGLKKMTNP